MNNLINHVSPETADRLKAAGFPQPVPEFGQVWYEPKSERELICIKPANLVDRTFSFMYPSGTGTLFNAKDIVFAPNATDILRELSHENIKISFYENDGFNIELNYDSFYGADKTFEHKNPAEAAALLFFYLKGIPAQK